MYTCQKKGGKLVWDDHDTMVKVRIPILHPFQNHEMMMMNKYADKMKGISKVIIHEDYDPKGELFQKIS